MTRIPAEKDAQRSMPDLIDSPETIPNGILALCLYCADHQVTLDQLKEIMVGVLPETTPVFRPCVNAAIAFGMLEEVDGRLNLTVTPEKLSQYMRAKILEVDAAFREMAEHFLELDPWAPQEKSWDKIQKSGRYRHITNATQWRNFSRWMRFLGLGVRRQGFLFPDPTQAVQDVLLDVIHTGSLIKAGTVIGGLCERLPFQVTVERRLPASLSLAIQALERQGKIHLEKLSDTETFELTLPNGPVYFSHLSLEQA